MKSFLKILLLVNVLSFTASAVDSSIDDHIIVHLVDTPENHLQHSEWNNKSQDAIDQIKKRIKLLDNWSIADKSRRYPHKKNEVFVVRSGVSTGTITLHKPLFVDDNDMIKVIKEEFEKVGLEVACSKDHEVTIAASVDVGFEGESFSLSELKKYAEMSLHDFDVQINDMQKKALLKSAPQDSAKQIEKLEKIKEMRKMFFWHLQVPTVGLLKGGADFDIPNDFKPLAWHFLLWDLAPKKGKGVRVAVIDTGVSSFNIDSYASAFNTEKDNAQKSMSRYKKNQSLEMPSEALNYYGYDLVSENGLDPVEQLAINIMQYCDHSKFSYKELLKNLPIWIKEFLISKNSVQIEDFIVRAGNPDLRQSTQHLSKKGRKVLNDLLYGDYGILPNGETKFFKIVHLEEPYNEEFILQTLPAPQITGADDTFIAGHGSFTFGIIGGKQIRTNPFIGIAPQADVIMIKAFADNGSTAKSTLNAGLERAKMLDANLVSMSLKITDKFNQHNETDVALHRLINSFDYIVAASGNNGEPGTPNYAGKKEAYPAKFKTVAFDVGAFSYKDATYPVSPFTQAEPNIGPKFAAPGFNILAPGLEKNQEVDSNYVFMGGTSVAVPVVSGVMALILAEFQEKFYREEILKVVYKSAIKMSSSSRWKDDILLGSIDARSSLLCLHILDAFKTKLEKRQKEQGQKKSSKKAAIDSFSLKDKFDNAVEAIYTAMFYLPLYYGQLFKIDLNKDFAGYQHAINTKQVKLQRYFSPAYSGQRGVEETVEFVSNLLMGVLGHETTADDDVDGKLVTSLRAILLGDIHLFSHLPEAIQTRINDVLYSSRPDDSYWTNAN